MGKRLGKREVLLKEMQGLILASKIERILYVPHDHLNQNYGVLKSAKKNTDAIVLVESARMLTGRNWHKERLFFLTSSARHFAYQLEHDGYTVRYIKAPTTIDGLKIARKEFGNLEISCAEPSSHVQQKQLAEFGVQFVENDFFLTSRSLFKLWAEKQKTYVMETFYRAQRNRLDILVADGKPEGGQWNYDADNRLPPPKNYEWPAYLEHERDTIDLEVAKQFDHTPTKTWATTRVGALKQLKYFVENHLSGFGPYEDAIAKDNWALHHSLLSPYLNNGLLHASEVVAAAIKAYDSGKAPIGSVEAFVRQIIGWREYINGMYWFLGEDYKNLNGLGANRKLLPLFNDSSKTQMACVKSVVADVEARAWTHHIPRLMVLGNAAMQRGYIPGQVNNWFIDAFADGTPWVMPANVIGMSLYADGGMMSTKPYAAGGAYIKKMSNFCGDCTFDPAKRVGEDACPFTAGYWNFLHHNRERFSKNHRMSQPLAGLKRLSDLDQLVEQESKRESL